MVFKKVIIPQSYLNSTMQVIQNLYFNHNFVTICIRTSYVEIYVLNKKEILTTPKLSIYEKKSKYITHNVLPNRFYLRLQKGK